MITPMSLVTVLGPRRLQRAVVEAVQDLGVLHVDHVRPASEDIAPRELAEEDQATRAALEAVRTRAEGILALRLGQLLLQLSFLGRDLVEDLFVGRRLGGVVLMRHGLSWAKKSVRDPDRHATRGRSGRKPGPW